MKARSLWRVLGLAGLVLAAGCGGATDSSSSDGAIIDPAALRGTWVPESFGPVGDSTSADADVVSTLTLEDGQANGVGGVNRFTTTYEAGDDGTMSFGMVASTRMAGEDRAMAQENELFRALENAESFEIADDKLVLSDADHATLVVLARE